MFESLEQRCLMSLVQTGAFLDDGVLRFNGGSGDDSLVIRREGETIVALWNFDNGDGPPRPIVAEKVFDLADVRRIAINGFGGEDSIVVDGQLSMTARLSGGAGSDTIWGGKGNDTIRGGDGDDVLIGRFGDDVIFGDAGDDRINGRNGNDHINAGAGDDRIRDLRGQNAIHGGEGADQARLDGGALPLGSGIEEWLWSGGGTDNPFQPHDPEEYGAILYWDNDRLMLEFNRTVNGDRYEFARLQVSDGVYEVVVTHEMRDFGLGAEHFMHRWDVTAAAGSKLVFTLNRPLSSAPVVQTALLLPGESIAKE